jgi:hypothetical protein
LETPRAGTFTTKWNSIRGVFDKIGLVGSKFVEAELVGRFAKILGEIGHDPQVIARGDRRIVATLEFLPHHLA